MSDSWDASELYPPQIINVESKSFVVHDDEGDEEDIPPIMLAESHSPLPSAPNSPRELYNLGTKSASFDSVVDEPLEIPPLRSPKKAELLNDDGEEDEEEDASPRARQHRISLLRASNNTAMDVNVGPGHEESKEDPTRQTSPPPSQQDPVTSANKVSEPSNKVHNSEDDEMIPEDEKKMAEEGDELMGTSFKSKIQPPSPPRVSRTTIATDSTRPLTTSVQDKAAHQDEEDPLELARRVLQQTYYQTPEKSAAGHASESLETPSPQIISPPNIVLQRRTKSSDNETTSQDDLPSFAIQSARSEETAPDDEVKSRSCIVDEGEQAPMDELDTTTSTRRRDEHFHTEADDAPMDEQQKESKPQEKEEDIPMDEKIAATQQSPADETQDQKDVEDEPPSLKTGKDEDKTPASSSLSKSLHATPFMSKIPRPSSFKDDSNRSKSDTVSTKQTDWARYLDHTSKTPRYRNMTPNRELQSSERSSAWLQDELKRRSIIKMEINKAILARNPDNKVDSDDVDGGGFSENSTDNVPEQDVMTTSTKNDGGFANDLVKALESLKDQPLHADDSVTVDAEVAALNLEDQLSLLGTPRKLDYESPAKSKSRHRKTLSSGSGRRRDGLPPRSHSRSGSTDFAQRYGTPSTPSKNLNRSQINVKRMLATGPAPATPSSLGGSETPSIDAQQEMKRFANTTRAALREDSYREPESPFRPISVLEVEVPISVMHPHTLPTVHASHSDNSSLGNDVSMAPDDEIPAIPAVKPTGREVSDDSEFEELKTGRQPVLIRSMDDDYGIPMGDIAISLLNENSGSSSNATWASRVSSAIWRCRMMRRFVNPGLGGVEARAPGSPPKGRSSLPVDLDKNRVAGGVKSVESTQAAALRHLKHDEIDEACELYEDILFAYFKYFEKSLEMREQNPNGASGTTDFKPYLGVALHNIGILQLLNGQYKDAASFFTRAVENRKTCLGLGHPDHVTSLVKLAICLFALNDFGEAHSKLEEALHYARQYAEQKRASLADILQLAEILNNLGCLSYMCGQVSSAHSFFKESLDVQFDTLSESLYSDSNFAGHSISLSISITRANVGFVKLVTKDVLTAVTALEAALMEQQLLLKGAHDTLIATMDHLAVANLLNGNPGKAAAMFSRILQLQYSKYGPEDHRCFVTIDKIEMVRSQGANFESAVEELRKTFSIPEAEQPQASQTSKTTTPESSPKPPAPKHTTHKKQPSLESIQSPGGTVKLMKSSSAKSKTKDGSSHKPKGGGLKGVFGRKHKSSNKSPGA